MKNLLPGQLKVSVIFLITERCNLKCPYCFLSDRRSRASVPVNVFRKVVRRHRPLYLQLSGGEPTMHPDFEEIVQRSVRRPMLTQMTINGLRAAQRLQFFKKLPVKPVTAVSLDAAGPTHDLIRNREGLFDDVMETLDFLLSIRAPAALSATIFGPGQVETLPGGNMDQVEPLVRLAERLGVAIGIQPANPAPPEVRRELARELKKLNSPRVAASPAFLRLLEGPAPGPCLYNITHISYDAGGRPLPTSPGNCYFLDNCDECFYACVREPSVVFRGAFFESAAHFAQLALRHQRIFP